MKWTKEACASEALKYTRRADFSAGSKGAYLRAMRKGWLNEVCGHMNPRPDWTIEKVASVAARYETRKSFAVCDGAAYLIAQRRGWLDIVCAHMGVSQKLKIFSRSVYVLRSRGSRTVYVGLSVDPKRRRAGHALRGRKEVKDLLRGSHRMLVLSPPLPAEEAADLERRAIARFRECGWEVLNVTSGGGLGGGPIKWTPEALRREALNYSSIKDFRERSPSAYGRARGLGIGADICSHMKRSKVPDGYWTPDRIKSVLAQATSRTEAGRGRFRSAYRYAAKAGILQDALAHLPNLKGKNFKDRRRARRAHSETH